MIARIIRGSIANRFWVLLVAAAIVIMGVLSARNIPIDKTLLKAISPDRTFLGFLPVITTSYHPA